MDNKYTNLYKNGNIFWYYDTKGITVAIRNSKGKIVPLKKNLNYWDVRNYIENRCKGKTGAR